MNALASPESIGGAEPECQASSATRAKDFLKKPRKKAPVWPQGGTQRACDWTSAQVDRALDDLVQHGLAAFSTDEGPMTMRLLENEPTPEEIEAMCDEHD